MMTSVVPEFPLQAATRQISDHLLDNTRGDHINKVEINREFRLLFELVLDGDRRWFRWDDGVLTELDAAKDRKVPLAGKLRNA